MGHDGVFSALDALKPGKVVKLLTNKEEAILEFWTTLAEATVTMGDCAPPAGECEDKGGEPIVVALLFTGLVLVPGGAAETTTDDGADSPGE